MTAWRRQQAQTALVVLVQGSWADLHSESPCTVVVRRSWVRRLAMSEQNAGKPDMPKSVTTQGFSLDEKTWIANQSKKGGPPETIAREIGRALSTVYTCYSDEPILRSFEFYQHNVKVINRCYVILSVYEQYVIVIHILCRKMTFVLFLSSGLAVEFAKNVNSGTSSTTLYMYIGIGAGSLVVIVVVIIAVTVCLRSRADQRTMRDLIGMNKELMDAAFCRGKTARRCLNTCSEISEFHFP